MFASCLGFLATVSTASSFAQGWLPANATIFDKEGTVAGVLPNTLAMITKHKAKWLIQVHPHQSEILVTGTALPAFLHPGLFVRFTAEFADGGALKDEIKELEIFTPMARQGVGIFPQGADEKSRPVTKLDPGIYEIRGKILTCEDGDVQILAGKKISGRVASDAKVSINASDISLAQPEDEIKVVGYFFKGFEPSPRKVGPVKRWERRWRSS